MSATLTIKILGDATGAQKEMKSVMGSIESMNTKALVAAGALAGLGAVTVKAASDQAEALNKVNVVFGANAGTIEAWADNAAQAMGMSKTAALDAAGGFGTMFTQLGFGVGPAAEMSQGLVELGADLASFHNLSGGAAEASEMMSAALRGEYDSLQRVIPTINAAAVEQRALADTGKASAAELTAAEKAAATYALMLEGAGPALGDFERTSEGLANKQRSLTATLSDVSAEIGSALIPVVEAFLPLLESAAEWAGQNTDALVILAGAVAVGSGTILAINGAMKAYAAAQAVMTAATAAYTGIRKAATSADLVGKGINLAMTAAAYGYAAAQGVVRAATIVWTGVQWALNVALSANPIGLVVIAIAALVAGFAAVVIGVKKAYDRFDAFKNVVDAVWGAIKTAIRWIGDLIAKIGQIKFPSLPSWLGGGERAAAAAGYRLTPATGYSASGGPVAITVNVSGARDPETTARTVARQLDRSARRNGLGLAGAW